MLVTDEWATSVVNHLIFYLYLLSSRLSLWYELLGFILPPTTFLKIPF